MLYAAYDDILTVLYQIKVYMYIKVKVYKDVRVKLKFQRLKKIDIEERSKSKK